MTSVAHAIARHIVNTTLIGVLAKIAAAGREVYIAAAVGLAVGVDAFYVALVIPSVLGGVLGNATHAAFIPLLTRLEGDTSGRRERFINTVVTATIVVGVVLLGAVYLGTRQWVRLIGPGLSDVGVGLATEATWIVAPALIAAPLVGLLTAILQVDGRFAFAAVAYGLVPVGTLVTLVTLWPSMGQPALAVSALSGYLLSAGVLVLELWRTGHRWRPTLDLRMHEVRELGAQFVPLLFASTIVLSNIAIDRAVASTLGVGAVAALGYGMRLILAPTELLSTAIGSVLFPFLARADAREGTRAFAGLLSRSLAVLASMVVPLVGIVAGTSALIVRVVFERGAFGASAAEQTSAVVFWLAPIVALTCFHTVLTRAFQAQLRSRALAILAALNAVLNLLLNLLLAPLMGVGGIALSTSVTILVVVVAMWVLWDRQERSGHPEARVLARSVVVAAAGFVTSSLVTAGFLAIAPTIPPIMPLAVAWLAGGCVAIVVGLVIGLREPLEIARVAGHEFIGKARPRSRAPGHEEPWL